MTESTREAAKRILNGMYSTDAFVVAGAYLALTRPDDGEQPATPAEGLDAKAVYQKLYEAMPPCRQDGSAEAAAYCRGYRAAQYEAAQVISHWHPADPHEPARLRERVAEVEAELAEAGRHEDLALQRVAELQEQLAARRYGSTGATSALPPPPAEGASDG